MASQHGGAANGPDQQRFDVLLTELRAVVQILENHDKDMEEHVTLLAVTSYLHIFPAPARCRKIR